MVTTDQIKELREATGVSVMQCKKALEEANGDFDKALIILRKISKDFATKKAGRVFGSGTIASYIHGGLVGVLVELLCETDFVSGNEEFRALARDIAMQVAASSPEFTSMDDVPEDAKKTAREVFEKEIDAKKPDAVKAQIMEGKLKSYFKERVLLEQEFIKNPEVTIQGLIDGAIQKFGEKIALTRFVRFVVPKK